MIRKALNTIALTSFTLVAMLGAMCEAHAQDAKAPYPTIAPLDQYLLADRNAEIELARSAAPESISKDAEVMVLGRHGYETAAKGKNGFVCLVQRSWMAGIDDPDFWNSKLRAPICLNPPATRSFLPLIIKRTELILAGRSRNQMFEDMQAAVDKKELPTPEPGAMCYMLSKQGYLSDRDPRWHPHLMFFIPLTEPATWGAGLPGSPVVAAFTDTPERLTVFLVPVAKWSDGTDASMDEH
ncbi:MAG TPA: hypothetical protein VNW47_09515 [Terriglobales bacterium]|nr:hypothetical protein [Terriglobales bacterium]